MREAIRRAREERQPILVEAITYRFRGHSMADPEEYRTQGAGRGVAQARPDQRVRRAAGREGVLDEEERGADSTRRPSKRVDEAVAFADESPVPGAGVAVRPRLRLGDQVEGWYSVDERSAGVHKGEDERALAEAERGPEGAYHEADEAAEREDVGRGEAGRRGAGRRRARPRRPSD